MWNVAWKKRMSYFKYYPLEVNDEVYELRLKINMTGKRLRVLLSNEFSHEDLKIRQIDVSLDQKNYLPLTFSKQKECCIKANQKLYSDPISINIDQEYIYLRIISGSSKIYTLGQTKDDELISINGHIGYYFGVESIEIDNPKEFPSICFFGDSLTDQSLFTSPFTKYLYQETIYTTYNCGISGNRMLKDADSVSLWESSFGQSGLSRFEKDVFSQTNPEIVIVLIGINDLYHPGNGSPLEQLPIANELINGLKSMINIANKHHCLCVPCTIPPFKGTLYHGKDAWDLQREKIRLQFNSWIRSLDLFIDVYNFVKGHDVQRLNECYDCGDHLHFNQQCGHDLGEYMYKYIKCLRKEDTNYEL